jgi:AraC-like DNA-binding protein
VCLLCGTWGCSALIDPPPDAELTLIRQLIKRRQLDLGHTSFAGLELIRRYFRSIDLAGHIRRHLKVSELEGDYGVVSMVLLVLGLLICGGRRLQHLIYLKEDPMILRLAGLKRLPTPRTLGRWLRRFRIEHVDRLLRVNDELVADAIRQAGLRRLSLPRRQSEHFGRRQRTLRLWPRLLWP